MSELDNQNNVKTLKSKLGTVAISKLILLYNINLIYRFFWELNNMILKHCFILPIINGVPTFNQHHFKFNLRSLGSGFFSIWSHTLMCNRYRRFKFKKRL